jgi:hypothetical protein
MRTRWESELLGVDDMNHENQHADAASPNRLVATEVLVRCMLTPEYSFERGAVM